LLSLIEKFLLKALLLGNTTKFMKKKKRGIEWNQRLENRGNNFHNE